MLLSCGTNSILLLLFSKTILEEPEEDGSGSVSPPALEPLNTSTKETSNGFSYNDLTRMNATQLLAVAQWQGAQIEHQDWYLKEKKNGKCHQQQLMLSAYNKLAQLQSKVRFTCIYAF